MKPFTLYLLNPYIATFIATCSDVDCADRGVCTSLPGVCSCQKGFYTENCGKSLFDSNFSLTKFVLHHGSKSFTVENSKRESENGSSAAFRFFLRMILF